MTFQTWLNTLRIEEAKTILTNVENYLSVPQTELIGILRFILNAGNRQKKSYERQETLNHNYKILLTRKSNTRFSGASFKMTVFSESSR